MNTLSPRDITFMRQAIDMAMKGCGRVEPNPMVGAVIVQDNHVVATGYHEFFGGPHAEVNALKNCRDNGIDPAGMTLFCNLEPCSHQGKQPPCVEAILEAKIARVVVGMVDPFEEVSGRGIEQLRNAGVEVTVGVCEERSYKLNEPFVKRVVTGLPWVICKWAQTVDGKTATTTGDSKWISCDHSRGIVHDIRARVDAIMVGVRTVELDNPVLNARDVDVKRVAKRIVIDPNLRIPMKSNLLHDDGPPVFIAASEKIYEEEKERVKDLQQHGVQIIPTPMKTNSRLDLAHFFKFLVCEHGVTNILVEGGANLIGTLLADDLADQLLVFVAPRIAGDHEALSAVNGHNLHNICDTHHLELERIEQIMDDILLDYRVMHPGAMQLK